MSHHIFFKRPHASMVSTSSLDAALYAKGKKSKEKEENMQLLLSQWLHQDVCYKKAAFLEKEKRMMKEKANVAKTNTSDESSDESDKEEYVHLTQDMALH